MYIHQHPNEHKHIIPDSVPGFPFHSLVSRLWPFTSFKAQPFGSIMPMHAWSRFSPFMVVVCIFLLAACSNFIHPVKSTPEPTEYSFNYWLLQRTYLYEDELPNLAEDGDSVQDLYKTLKDPYTSYIPPSKSETAKQQLSTSVIIGGDIGMRYYNYKDLEHPILISRVFPKAPAGRAGVPRYGNIISANEIELTGERAAITYDSILSYSKNVNIRVAYKGDTTLYKLKKETVFAPTVFVDTLYRDSAKGYPGIVFVTIEIFKDSTENLKFGTYGELKDYLDSTTSDKRVRVLDLRGNPGGIVRQCLNVADLFVSKGTLSTRHSHSLTADGGSTHYTTVETAHPGDPGETGNYIILADRTSASCAEIFIAAVTELTDIPFIGTRTYGKGVGQTPYDTYAGGIAKITNFEFFTPKGNSYNQKGIFPKYECNDVIGESCAAQIAKKIYGVKIPKQETVLAKYGTEIKEQTVTELEGGAIIWTNENNFLKAFEESNR